jgi:hypothetical protein
MSMIEKLASGRVMTIEPLGNGLWQLWEECDSYFSEVFTSQELAALGNELIALANTDKQEP